jgi:FkbM family methyltransferase
MRQLIKSIVPASAWNFAKNHYNRARYSRLWYKREVSTFTKEGQTIHLVIVDRSDVIQSEQRRGFFYEEDELDSISKFFPRGGTFLDIGANTGQHSIYFAELYDASVILVEPVPETCKLLRENIRINELELKCDLFLGMGFSDKTGRANIEVHLANLGSASISENQQGEIPTVMGDEVLVGRKIDMMKIDTEGFEMKVLAGLRNTIERERPLIYIEIDNANLDDFNGFVQQARYTIRYRNKRYPQNENFLIAPIS